MEKQLIRKVMVNSENEVRTLLSELPDSINVGVEIMDWDIEVVGGVTGRTETNSPPLVAIQISNKFSGSITQAIHTALRPTVFHEFHHLYRGWAIQDNKFGYGIPNAMVNEGLAVVFKEMHTGTTNEVNAYTDEADNWVQEILELPLNASYVDWVMGEHPDGIGYSTGNFLVRKAMVKSDKSILGLNGLTPERIIQLAGY